MTFMFLRLICFVCAFGMGSAFAGIVQDEVAQVLDTALSQKKIFQLREGRTPKQRGFYPFFYDIPESILKDPKLTQNFITCLQMTIQEERLVGPERRPLTIIPKSTQFSVEFEKGPSKKRKAEDDSSGSSYRFGNYRDSRYRDDDHVY